MARMQLIEGLNYREGCYSSSDGPRTRGKRLCMDTGSASRLDKAYFKGIYAVIRARSKMFVETIATAATLVVIVWSPADISCNVKLLKVLHYRWLTFPSKGVGPYTVYRC